MRDANALAHATYIYNRFSKIFAWPNSNQSLLDLAIRYIKVVEMLDSKQIKKQFLSKYKKISRVGVDSLK